MMVADHPQRLQPHDFAFRNSNLSFLMRLSFLKDFSSSHLAPFQDMISRTGHEWLRLPGRKGLLAKLVTRQEFRAETEDGEGAMCWGKCIHLEAVRKPGSTVGFLGMVASPLTIGQFLFIHSLNSIYKLYYSCIQDHKIIQFNVTKPMI